MMNDEESPLPSPVPVAFGGLPTLSQALGTLNRYAELMPLSSDHLFEPPRRKHRDLRILVVSHDGEPFMGIRVDERADFFSA